MTTVPIFIYGWLIDHDKIMESNKKVNDYYKYEKYIEEKTKDIDVICINRDYDSIDLDGHPYYVYLNYIDMNNINCEITNKKFKALKRLNKCENKILDLDEDRLNEIESDLNINLKNPQIYIDCYDCERNYQTF